MYKEKRHYNQMCYVNFYNAFMHKEPLSKSLAVAQVVASNLRVHGRQKERKKERKQFNQNINFIGESRKNDCRFSFYHFFFLILFFKHHNPKILQWYA